LNSVQIP